MSVETYKGNLEHFEGPNVDNDSAFARLNSAQQASYTRYVSRANMHYANAKKYGIPRDYRENLEIIQEDFKRCNVDVPVNYEAIYALDTAFTQTIYDINQYAKLGVTSNSMGTPAWQSKGYRTDVKEWPRATKEFNNPRTFRLVHDDGWSDGFGIYQAIGMSWQTIKESGKGLWNPLAILNQQGGEKFGLMMSRIGFRGYDSYELKGDDGRTPSYVSATGLLNNSNSQTFQGGAGDDEDLTADGDVLNTIKKATVLYDKIYTQHKKILITSRGVAAETLQESHRDTYGQKTDLMRIKEKFFDTGVIDGWMITDQVYSAGTPANTAQDMYLVGIGSGCQHDVLPYPLQRLSMNDKKFAGDYKECMIWGRICEYKQADTTNNAFPLAAVAAACNTTETGVWLPQGWFDVNKWAPGKPAGAVGL